MRCEATRAFTRLKQGTSIEVLVVGKSKGTRCGLFYVEVGWLL
jgi:hypothetical protein